MKFLLLTFTLSLIAVFSKAQGAKELAPGIWGGQLVYNNQTTDFFLEFRRDEDKNITAHLTLPITNFHDSPLGLVEASESTYMVGSIQFSFNESGNTITGKINIQSGELSFKLLSVSGIPEKKAPYEGVSTATPVWTYQTDAPVWGDAASDGTAAFIGSTDGSLYSIDVATGELNWVHKTGGAIFSRPLIHEEHIYVLVDDGFLYKLSKETGDREWLFNTESSGWIRGLPDDEKPGYDSMSSAPIISGSVVYAGSPSGYVFAIDKDSGGEIWRFQTGAPILSIPAIENDVLFVGSLDHHVYAIHKRSGELIWKYDTGQVVVSSPAVKDGIVIIGSRSATLTALQSTNGEPIWKHYFWFSWVESSGVFLDDTFYIGSSDLQLLKAINPDDGQLLWSYDTGGSPWTTPAVSDKTVFSGVFGNSNYFIDHRGGFVAIDRKTGFEKWRYVMNPRPDTHIYGVVSSPVVAKGKVVFGGLDGLIYGFNVTNED